MALLDEYSEEILDIYKRELDDSEAFHHALEELGKHPSKLAKLHENEETEHLREEIADVLLLAHVLRVQNNVNQDEIDSAAEHFIDKIDRIYTE